MVTFCILDNVAVREQVVFTTTVKCTPVFGLVYWGLTPSQPRSYRLHNQGHIEAVMTRIKYQFHWWRKPEHPEGTTDLQQVTVTHTACVQAYKFVLTEVKATPTPICFMSKPTSVPLISTSQRTKSAIMCGHCAQSVWESFQVPLGMDFTTITL